MKYQAGEALRMIHSLASKEDQAIRDSGSRIEVTAKAKSLRDAHRLVNDTNNLDSSYWKMDKLTTLTAEPFGILRLMAEGTLVKTSSTTGPGDGVVLVDPYCSSGIFAS
jgi:hypothetical protein